MLGFKISTILITLLFLSWLTNTIVLQLMSSILGLKKPRKKGKMTQQSLNCLILATTKSKRKQSVYKTLIKTNLMLWKRLFLIKLTNFTSTSPPRAKCTSHLKILLSLWLTPSKNLKPWLPNQLKAVRLLLIQSITITELIQVLLVLCKFLPERKTGLLTQLFLEMIQEML